MTTLWIFIAAILIPALAIVWYQYFRSQQIQETTENIRRETNVTLYHEHLAELDKDLAEGGIDQENYDYLKAELDKTLLEDVANDAGNAKVKADKSMALFWPISLSLFVVVFSVGVYTQIGSHEILAQTQITQEDDPHAALNPEQQAMFRIKQLQNQVETEQTNSQAWFNLGYAYMNVGQFAESADAFDKVIALVGEHAELLGPKAQALYFQNQRQMTPQIKVITDKALSLDPTDPSTNVLLGMDAYAIGQFEKAIGYWRSALKSNREDVNREALTSAIADAESQLSGEPVVVAEPEATGPKVTVSVSLSDEIYQAMGQGEDKTVFVYATPANGPRMPVAAVKIMASDLPTTIVLSDAQAMNPNMTISKMEQVNLYAVVSKLGSVGIKPGDFKAEMRGVSTSNPDVISLTIDTLVK